MSRIRSPQWPVELIADGALAAQRVELLRGEPILSIDTETVGWREGNERLCLVQVGSPSLQRVFIFDTVGWETLAPLAPIITGESPKLIAHNAEFEARQFARYGLKMRGAVDTLTMARRLREDLPSHSLASCCHYLLGFDLSKEEQTSDWSVRPLSDDQLRYAQLDAEVAYELYQFLAAIEERLTVSPELAVPELMRELVELHRTRYRLTREIAPELEFLRLREEALKEAVKYRLTHGDPPYESELGRAEVKVVQNTVVNPVKVRAEFPQFADQVIVEAVERKRILAVMKEYGFDDKDLKRVLDPSTAAERLTLKVRWGGGEEE